MSTLQSITQIHELREEISQTSAGLRSLTNLVADGRIGLRDFLVFSRLVFGGNKNLDRMMADTQLFISTLITAKNALRLLKVEMGPAGWVMLAGSALVGTIAVDFMMNGGE